MVLNAPPIVGDLRRDGTKIINVYDAKTDTRRDIQVTEQEADEFINQRAEKLKQAGKKASWAVIIPSVLGTLIGAVVSKASRLMGAMGGLALGLFAAAGGYAIFDPKKVDKKHTQEFIEKNAEKENIQEKELQAQPTFKGAASKPVDLTDKYSQEEIVEILKTVGTYDESKILMPPKYQVELCNSETLVINNENRTNDTTVIKKDGSVKHVGSWHNKEIAPAGSFTFLVEDALAKLK